MFGIVFWTLLEYIIHRFLGHQNKATHIIRLEHKRHHAEWNYFAPWHKKLMAALFFFTITTLLCNIFFALSYAISFSFGLSIMYIIYEAAHKFYHIQEPKIRYGLKMRKHHFYHHFTNPKFNHGVTTAFWDRIFGTYRKTDVVQVPKNMAMRWLFNKQQIVKYKYMPHFSLR